MKYGYFLDQIFGVDSKIKIPYEDILNGNLHHDLESGYELVGDINNTPHYRTVIGDLEIFVYLFSEDQVMENINLIKLPNTYMFSKEISPRIKIFFWENEPVM